MKAYLFEVYNEKTNWKIQKAKTELHLKFADMFRAGIQLLLEKYERDGVLTFSEEEYENYLKDKNSK